MPFIDEYTLKFKELACQVNYLARNPETRQLFLYGLPRNILEEVMKGGAPPMYQDLKQRAVDAVRSRQTIDNIVRWRDHVPHNPFSNNSQPCPFYSGSNHYDNQRRQNYPQQQQWTLSNAPRQFNNTPDTKDLDPTKVTRFGGRGSESQTSQPRTSQPAKSAQQ